MTEPKLRVRGSADWVTVQPCSPLNCEIIMKLDLFMWTKDSTACQYSFDSLHAFILLIT